MSKHDQNSAQPPSDGSRRPWAQYTFMALVVYAAACFVLGLPRLTSAAQVPTGPGTIDTVIRDDMTAAYYLSSTASQISVVDPATDQVLFVIPLSGIPGGITQDIDWNESAQRIVVSCSDGRILSVDPATSTFVVHSNQPGSNFQTACAENWTTPGTFGWALDNVTNTLYQVLSTGALIPAGPMPIGANVELAEKVWYSGSPATHDGYLLAVGTSGAGFTNVCALDRATMLFTPLATWGTGPAAATGIASIKGPDVYVSANAPGGLPGYLLHLNLTTWAFNAAPDHTFMAETTYDVSSTGAFVTVLTNGVGGGSVIQLFDVGDPTVPLHAGSMPSSPNGPGGGMDSGGGGESPEDIFCSHSDVGTGGTSLDFADALGAMVDTPPAAITGIGDDPVNTPGPVGMAYDYEAVVCTDCEPRETQARGAMDSADNREYAHTAKTTPSTAGTVQYATGEEVKSVPLFSVPGVGIDVDFVLTYRSRRDYDYRYGQGWFLNQDVRLRAEPNGDKTFLNGRGRQDTYTLQPGGAYMPPVHYDTTLSAGPTTTITNRFGMVSTFNAGGYRTMLNDRYGNQVTYTWTGDKLTGITDTLGRGYTLAYDGTGRLSSIIDFGGRTWSFMYDYLGQLRKITTPVTTQFTSGREFWFSYSGNHSQTRFRSNLIHCWNARKQIVQTLHYDANDLIYREEIGPGQYDIAYDVVNKKTIVVDRSGNYTEWTFGVFAMPIKIERFTKGLRVGEPVSYVTTYSIDSNGLPITKVLPRNNRIDYVYDPQMNLVEVRYKEMNTPSNNPTDIVWQYTYGGPFSQLTQATDPRGNTTTMVVDGWGNTTQVNHATVTSPATQVITENFAYDGQGRITSATDGEGRTTTFGYHMAGPQTGYLQSVTNDPSGLSLTTSFSYDQFGNIVSVTDPRGNTVSITVDAENYVEEIAAPSPLNYRRRITYDADRNVTRAEVENIDRKGNLDPTTPWIPTTLTYNEMGWVLTRTQKLTTSVSATTAFAYSDAGLVTRVIHPEGNEETVEYDERLLLFKVTRGAGSPDASTTRRDYDENGNLVVHTDGRGNPTLFEYDLFDRRTKTTDALGHYVEFAYNAASDLTTATAYDNTATMLAQSTRHYDEINRVWKVVRDRFGLGLTASTPTTTFTRDRSHRVTTISDPLSNTTTFAYDAAGRRASATDAAGNKVIWTRDGNGNPTKIERVEVPAVGGTETFVTEYVYDEMNRVVTQKEIDRLNAANILTTTFEYDSRSNLTFRTDAEGHPVRWTYDLAGRLTSYERALQVGSPIDVFIQSIEEEFEYDKNHRLTTVTDDNFNSTDYAYDELNRRTRTTHADSKFVEWTFDENDNVTTWTDQNGTVATNTHDVVDRLTARSVSLGSGVAGTTSETYTYDGLGRVRTAADNDFQLIFDWDSVGNLLREQQGYTAVGQEKWKLVLAGYTDAGSVSSVNYPSAYQFTHARDSIYRLTGIYDVGASANVATFSWQGTGRLAQTNNQNGTVTEYTYDGFGRTQVIDHILSGGSGSLHRFDYLYDMVHNRRMEKNTFSASWVSTLPANVQTFLGGRNGKGDVYAYDMAYRMVDARYDVTNPASEVATPGSQAYTKLVQYTIDGVGNRSQVQTSPPTPATTVTYAADVVNQYTSLGGVTRAHDNNGNLTDDGTQLYVYDYKNRLVEVKLKSSGATIATYRYDAIGRRVEKAVAGGATTRYVLLGHQVIEEYDGSDQWQAAYIYEDGIDRPRAMDRADIADVNGNANTTEVLRFHYHQNALSSTSELTQPSGAVVEWVSYDAYGAAAVLDQNGTAVAQSAVGNPFLFTGREYDAESGLYFYRARSYDPVAGRFLQRDSAGYVDGLGLHEYVRSSPTTRSDPSGAESELDQLTNQARVGLSTAREAFGRIYGANGTADRLVMTGRALESAMKKLLDALAEEARALSLVLEIRADIESQEKKLRAIRARRCPGSAEKTRAIQERLAGLKQLLTEKIEEARIIGEKVAAAEAAHAEAARDYEKVVREHNDLVAIYERNMASASEAIEKMGKRGEEFKDIGIACAVEGVIGAAAILPVRVTAPRFTYTRHGLHQAIGREGRGVNTRAILDAIKNPTKVTPGKNGALVYHGERATVVLNRQNQVVSTWANNRSGLRPPRD